MEDTSCENLLDSKQEVSNQQECQTLCVNKEKCAGISYSHDVPYYCGLCDKEHLLFSKAVSNFGFYRRPGNEKFCQ